jgi:hypothetical protein
MSRALTSSRFPSGARNRRDQLGRTVTTTREHLAILRKGNADRRLVRSAVMIESWSPHRVGSVTISASNASGSGPKAACVASSQRTAGTEQYRPNERQVRVGCGTHSARAVTGEVGDSDGAGKRFS